MKRQNRVISLLSLSLIFTLLVGCLMGLTLVTGAEETDGEETGVQAPEIVVEGEVSTWDKKTYLEPTEVDADGYILIECAEHFAWLLKNTVAGNTTNYRLTTNIDMNGTTFANNADRDFDGILDGNNYVVSNLNSGMSGYSGSGNLFDTVKGTIKNLTLDNFKTSGANSRASFIYSLSGGQLLNVRADITISATSYGSLVMYSNGDALIENVVVSGSVATGGNTGNAAGIVNEMSDTGATIRNCVNYAAISATNGNAAGILATVTGNTAGDGTKLVENCVNYGSVTGSKENIFLGGICGAAASRNSDPMTIRNCVNYGDVTHTASKNGLVHGIVGCGSDNGDGEIFLENCANYGTMTATNRVGGLVSSANYAVSMTDCVNYGAINGTSAAIAGGLVGQIDGNNYSSGYRSSLRLFNCANYGDVTGNNAGGFIGYLRGGGKTDYQGLYVNGGFNVGTISGVTNQGTAAGYMAQKGGRLVVQLENVYLGAGAISGASTEKVTSCTIGENVYVDKTAETPCGTANLTDDASTAFEKALASAQQTDVSYLTDGTFLAALNANAVANGYKKWMAVGAPNYIEFYVYAIELTNASSLNKTYDGTFVEVDYKKNLQSVATVDVEWYSLVDGVETLLDEAPVDAGSYRVKLVPKSSDGTIINPEDKVEADFTISKADVTINSLFPEGVTTTEEGNITATYQADGYTFAGEVVFGSETIATLTPEITGAGTAALEPGTYTITLTYAGGDNFNAASVTHTFVITKAQVQWPANVWTQENQVSIKYTGGPQYVTLKDLDTELFDVVYANNDASQISPEGEYLTATATITLKDTVHYELVGEEVTYALEYAVTKGDVVLKLVDENGDEVNLDTLYYDGVAHTFTVVVYNEHGDVVQTLDPLSVLDAGEYPVIFDYEGDEFYNAGTIEKIFVVLPAQITVTLPTLDKTYEGNAVVAELTYEKMGLTWQETITWYEVVGGEKVLLDAAPIDAGTYILEASVISENGNYCGQEEITFTISRAKIDAQWNTNGFTYNENTGKYEVTYDSQAHGVTIDTESDGTVVIKYGTSTTAQANAGEYVVSATITGGRNYQDITMENITIVIHKKVVDLPDNVNDLWDYDGGYVYNGTLQKVELDAAWLAANAEWVKLEEVGAGLFYIDNSTITAGTKTAKTTIILKDAENTAFEGTDAHEIELTLEWSIAKKEVSIGSIVLDKDTVAYNGKAQPPVLINLPNGFTYTLDREDSQFVNVGTYYVDVTFNLTGEVYSNCIIDGDTTITVEYEITPAQVEIIISGNDTYTYDKATRKFNWEVEDEYGNTYADCVTITIEKKVGNDWVVCTANDVRDAGEYRFTYQISSENMEGETVDEILTIKKAVYPENYYTVDGKVEVVYDGEEHTLELSTRAGLDNVKIIYENITGSFTEPGEHTIVFRLTGSDNYEPIPDYSVTLTILRATIADEDSNTSVKLENGLPHGWELKVENADTSSIDTEAEFGNAKLKVQGLFDFIIMDEEGEEQTISGKKTITIIIPEKLRDSKTLKFIQVTEKKGNLVIREFDDVTDLKKNYTYDAETGELTFTLSKKTDAKYGYVCEDPFPVLLVAAAGGGAVLVVLVVIVLVVILKKKKGPKVPKAPKMGGMSVDDVAVEEDTPWWAAPVETPTLTQDETSAPWDDGEETPAPEAEATPVAEAPEAEVAPENTPVAEEAIAVEAAPEATLAQEETPVIPEEIPVVEENVLPVVETVVEAPAEEAAPEAPAADEGETPATN